MSLLNRSADAIKRTRGSGFVDYTITRRLPKILADAEAQLGANFKTAQAMLQAVINGDPIDTTLFARPTDYWNSYLDQLTRATWDDLSFFDLEFLFYHGLNSIAGYFDNGTDIFHQVRQRALAEAIPPIATGLEQLINLSGPDLLKAAVRGALFANEADYSQLVTSSGNAGGGRVLADDSERWISQLPEATGTIHILADNAGRELCWDLVLVDALLRVVAGVTLQVKPWPMFVSDALAVDVDDTLNRFLRAPGPLKALGQRLKTALDSQQLQIQAAADWGEPRYFNALDKPLGMTLGDGASVIVKGDLNYRRLVQDRLWPLDTPTSTAAAGVPFKAFALRVLKSDALVGIEPAVAQTAAAEFDDWRTRGHFALMQLL